MGSKRIAKTLGYHIVTTRFFSTGSLSNKESEICQINSFPAHKESKGYSEICGTLYQVESISI